MLTRHRVSDSKPDFHCDYCGCIIEAGEDAFSDANAGLMFCERWCHRQHQDATRYHRLAPEPTQGEP